MHVAPYGPIALPPNRYFYTNSDNRLHNFAVPSNTVEITDGFSNALAVDFTLSENAAFSFIFSLKLLFNRDHLFYNPLDWLNLHNKLL